MPISPDIEEVIPAQIDIDEVIEHFNHHIEDEDLPPILAGEFIEPVSTSKEDIEVGDVVYLKDHLEYDLNIGHLVNTPFFLIDVDSDKQIAIISTINPPITNQFIADNVVPFNFGSKEEGDVELIIDIPFTSIEKRKKSFQPII